MSLFFVILLCFKIVAASIWKNGIVHYTINSKDYDAHSRDIIMTTFSQMQNEICVKFFQAQGNSSNSNGDRILYISNPDKVKTCMPVIYDFSKSVIDMPIGYKCLNQKDIARIVVDMLKTSINPTESAINSFDLIKQFEDKKSDTLISAENRNYINSKYHIECGRLSQPLRIIQRRTDINLSNYPGISDDNVKYYRDKLWPLGIVFYGIDGDLNNSEDHKALIEAMRAVALLTCVTFEEYTSDDVLQAKNYIWFGKEGVDLPMFGFNEGKQIIDNLLNPVDTILTLRWDHTGSTSSKMKIESSKSVHPVDSYEEIKLSSFLQGASGHTAHVMNNLLRVLGIHMMSNRYDRDNYVNINWNNIEKGKEHFFEKTPEEAWIMSIPYDFDSVTHAPANYMCENCNLGQTTVQPIQDRLWHRTLSMGHVNEMSTNDIIILNLIYNTQCEERMKNENISNKQ